MTRFLVERTFPEGLAIPVNEQGANTCLTGVDAARHAQRRSRPGLKAAKRALNQVKAGEAVRSLVSGLAASIQAFLLPTPARRVKNRKG